MLSNKFVMKFMCEAYLQAFELPEDDERMKEATRQLNAMEDSTVDAVFDACKREGAYAMRIAAKLMIKALEVTK